MKNLKISKIKILKILKFRKSSEKNQRNFRKHKISKFSKILIFKIFDFFFDRYFFRLKYFLKNNIFSIEFFRSKNVRRKTFRPHIPIQNFLKIPKTILRKLRDEAWCLKTKYIKKNLGFYKFS